MNCIETITALGNLALVPVNRIKYINFIYKNGWVIRIKGDDLEWEEHFAQDDEERARKRYEIMKELIQG
jgi:hypothetical protein